jgi:hypothetical protein
MSLEQAAYLGQVIAAIAVMGSLVFVSFQIRQNTRFQRIAAVDALSAAIAAINVPAMQSPALGEAISIATRDWGAASREQRIITHYFLFSYFKLAENAWYQRQAGLLEPAQWEGWDWMVRAYYHREGVQAAWWPQRRNGFSRPFQAYLAASAAPEGWASLGDLFNNAMAPKA